MHDRRSPETGLNHSLPVDPIGGVQLSRLTTFELGGDALRFCEASTDSQVEAAARWAEQRELELFVLGGGSNLLVADSGVEGLVLRMASTGIWLDEQATSVLVRANAGVPWDDLVQFAVERDLVGIECLSGIPGSVGATPIQNVGAYGQEISQTLTRVTAYDRLERRQVTLERDECRLSYRSSRFKTEAPNRYIILNVEFELLRRSPASPRHPELAARLTTLGGRQPSARDVRAAVLDLRACKGMLSTPEQPIQRSAGSFFVNPIVETSFAQRLSLRHGAGMPIFGLEDGKTKLSAAWLIENSGIKRGTRGTRAGVSPHHCLVIVAYESASAVDVVSFARHVRDTVAATFGVVLQPEPNFWGFQSFEHGLPVLAPPLHPVATPTSVTT
ncbi:MAG TPA: UDP-N-acetylmuramate dehydrogenase [Polyangiaceae bacterium]|nr:UDP-N-acetylmuramate dehydrogenase [Polyangiaceae bacterium]